MINISSECPRYEKCSVNNCPLHPSYPELYICEDDSIIKCTMEKQVRFKIGSKYSEILKYKGLTKREFLGKERYNNLSDEEKKRRSDIGKEALLRLKNKEKE